LGALVTAGEFPARSRLVEGLPFDFGGAGIVVEGDIGHLLAQHGRGSGRFRGVSQPVRNVRYIRCLVDVVSSLRVKRKSRRNVLKACGKTPGWRQTGGDVRPGDPASGPGRGRVLAAWPGAGGAGEADRTVSPGATRPLPKRLSLLAQGAAKTVRSAAEAIGPARCWRLGAEMAWGAPGSKTAWRPSFRRDGWTGAALTTRSFRPGLVLRLPDREARGAEKGPQGPHPVIAAARAPGRGGISVGRGHFRIGARQIGEALGIGTGVVDDRPGLDAPAHLLSPHVHQTESEPVDPVSGHCHRQLIETHRAGHRTDFLCGGLPTWSLAGG